MASSSSESESKVSLKMLIDTNANRVLFAEASKEFIDFLFNLLRLPIGAVTRLLTKERMVGSLGKLYESIENLNDVYLKNPTQDKNILLKPTTSLSSNYLLPVSVRDDLGVNYNTNSRASHLYKCGNHYCSSNDVTFTDNTKCPSCGNGMRSIVVLVGSNDKNTSGGKESCGGEGGFVKDVVTYTVMDDLEVRPMSSISTITLISKFKVKDIASLEERVVELGMEEGIKLLKASFQCKNVLTSVFLKNMAA